MQEKNDQETQSFVTDLMSDHKYYEVITVIENVFKDKSFITNTGKSLQEIKTKVKDNVAKLEDKDRKFLEDIKNGPREIQNMIVEIDDYLNHKVYTVVHEDIKSYR